MQLSPRGAGNDRRHRGIEKEPSDECYLPPKPTHRRPEAAEVLGIGERALKSRLRRARLRLAVALRASGDGERSDEKGALRLECAFESP